MRTKEYRKKVASLHKDLDEELATLQKNCTRRKDRHASSTVRALGASARERLETADAKEKARGE